MIRPSARQPNQLRTVSFDLDFNKYAEGSCLIKCGDTHVLCTASLDDRVPPFLRNSGRGWVTAEYGMLPRATDQRTDREAAKGKQSGRTQEIQRLIGRSLRAAVDLEAIGEVQIKIDCDVLQADGGTRCASITGGYVALVMALRQLERAGVMKDYTKVLQHQIAAVSCGVFDGEVILDLDYAEDSNAQADTNFIMTADGKIVEVQGTAEDGPFDQSQLGAMIAIASKGIAELAAAQTKALRAASMKDSGLTSQ